MTCTNYSRRKLLRLLAASGLLASAPISIALPFSKSSKLKLPRVILFEMFGGNDNLNTLVPYKDPLYKAYRPTVGLSAKEVTPIDNELAFNNALSPLLPAWERGQLAVIQDVGYPNSVLSHFKSIQLIETASSYDQAQQNGWIANTISLNSSLSDREKWDIDSVWAGGHIDALVGAGIIPYAPSRGAFSKYLAKYHAEDDVSDKYILNKTITRNTELSRQLKGRVPETSRFAKRFHDYDSNESVIGEQCTDVLRLIEGGINTPVYKIGMSGFDLHAGLRGAHEKVLDRAARHLANLRESLIELDEWDNTLILAFSEFGRRPKENASLGSDHGTCGPMFVLGGNVDGGIKGDRADLGRLNVDGNLHFKTDYRAVFSTVIDKWWQVDVNPLAKAGYHALPNIIS